MNRRRGSLTALVIATVMAVTGCGQAAPAGPDVLRAEGVSWAQPPADAPVPLVVEGIARFGHELAPTEVSNWVASPVSIAYALAMLRGGAQGDTAAQIDAAFGFPATGLHEAFNALSRAVVTDPVPPPRSNAKRKAGAPPGPTVVSVANALFPAKGFDIEQPFLRTLAEQYDTGVFPVDFTSDEAKQKIDDWARRQTADRIKKVFDKLAKDTALVLANTVYLRGDWTTPFDETSTRDAAFHRADGSTVQVPTMNTDGAMGYAEGNGWQAVQLPYGDGHFAMRILVPTGAKAPRDLLDPVLGAAVTAGLHNEAVELSLPRWDFATEVPLKAELIRLGVSDAFDPARADLHGISTRDLYVDQAVHKATITVDESGTEAAAVTALAVRTTAGMLPGRQVVADRPFAFEIVHVATGAPLFMGIVADPSAH
jgi:serpin B